jgi:hypothetical protein
MGREEGWHTDDRGDEVNDVIEVARDLVDLLLAPLDDDALGPCRILARRVGPDAALDQRL